MGAWTKAGPRILIVEDDPADAVDLQTSLEALGYQVIGVAETAAGALAATLENSPELILMDITLQGSIDGVAAVEEIRSKWGIPIVFVPGNSDEVSKPFRTRELNTAILAALQQHRLAREMFSEKTWVRTLLESLSDGVIATDPSGRVRQMNPAAEALTGHRFQEANGKPIEEICRFTTMSHEPVEHRHAAGKSRFLLHSRDGRVIPIEDTAAPIHAGGQVIGVVNVIADISRPPAEQAHATAEALGNTRAELRALSAHLLSVQEDERRRIARELHDDVVQRMALAEIDLQRLMPILSDQNGARELVETVRQRIAEVAASLREVSHRLHPAVVEDLGLTAALRSLVADYRDQGVDASLAASADCPTLKLDAATALYRIAQEALRNAWKHAPGAPVRVALEGNARECHLRIEDAGPGFDLRQVRGSGGLGLLGMQERARLAGGNLMLRTRPGNGTLILVRVPLEKRAADLKAKAEEEASPADESALPARDRGRPPA